jgi:putative ABC transport system permease protein
MVRRLWRDLKLHKGWIVAIVILIALSAGIYSSFRSTYDSGIKSFNRSKKDLDAADIVVSTIPGKDFSAQIADISGVSLVSPAFITESYTYKGKKVRSEVMGVEVGDRVNSYFIIKGRDIKKKKDVVVEFHYADNHNVKIGQKLTLYLNGKATNFRISGVCFSPDYIYLISPEGSLEKDLGIFFIPLENFKGLINTFHIKVSDKRKVDAVTSRVKTFFASRQVNAIVKPTSKTFANTAFKEDLGAMNSLADLFSVLLLAVSAFTLFVVLSRIVEKKRHEIGTLRAMGFTKRSIFFYYLAFSGVAVILGVILSIPLGYWSLSAIINYWGITVLGLPKQFISYALVPTHIGYSAVFSLIFAIVGAFIPSYRAASLKPAEAMRPFIASSKSSRVLSQTPISPTKKLIFRDMFGYRARSISTIISIALVLSLELSFVLSMGSLDEGVKRRFNKNEGWDIKVSFTDPQNYSSLSLIKKVQGVKRAEPLVEGGAEIAYKNKNTIIQLNKLVDDTKMRRFPKSKKPFDSDSIFISGDVAYRLKAFAGDRVTLYTPSGKDKVKISRVLKEFGASEGYTFGRLDNFTSALLKIKKGEATQVEESLRKLSFVKSWVKKVELRDGWLYLMDEYYGMVYVMDVVTAVLVLIAIGVFAFVSTVEREWEFVVLKSMGFSNRSVQTGGLLETFILSSLGALLGLPLGVQFAAQFNDTFKNLIAPPPVILIPSLVISRLTIVIAISLLTVFLVTRFILKRNVAEKLRQVFETM